MEPVLCRKPRLYAEPREPYDLSHAIKPRSSLERYSTGQEKRHVCRTAEGGWIQDRTDRKEPFAELLGQAAHAQEAGYETRLSSRQLAAVRSRAS